MVRRATIVLCLAAACASPLSGASKSLEVAESGPTGEVATLAEAGEIRVVFSEPMIALGKIPDTTEAPFFTLRPASKGSFRWSGTNTLVFTPSPKLPFATRFRVTIGVSAVSLAAHHLSKPHTFEFTTPTLRLLSASWRRKTDRYDSPAMIELHFNQPVDALSVETQTSLQYESHPFEAPSLSAEAFAYMKAVDPKSLADFDAKAARAKVAAGRQGTLPYVNDVSFYARSHPEREQPKEVVVLETKEVPPTDAWLRVWISPRVKGLEGPETPGAPQKTSLKLELTLFIESFRCQKTCDPDERNALHLRSQVAAKNLSQATTVADVTDGHDVALPRGEPVETPEEDEASYDVETDLTLQDAGYTVKPARTYRVRVDRKLVARDGQTLGYNWVGLIENWHQRAFTSFGSGHGVWESRGGPLLPFYSRNLRSVRQWATPLKVEDLMPTILKLRENSFHLSPSGEEGVERALAPAPDAIQSYGINLKTILSEGGTGIVWTALEDGDLIPRSELLHKKVSPESSLVQVTNLGLSVKDSPRGTLVFVTRLDTGEAVEGAEVSIRGLDNVVLWKGPTDKDGLAFAPETDLRTAERSWEFRFVVTAQKDQDIAYVGSDWNEGEEPWSFGVRYDLEEAKPLLRGAVFTDRGVYKLGEEIHFKTILRNDTAEGVKLLASGTQVQLSLKDSEGQDVSTRTLPLGDWSSTDFSLTLPSEGPLGRYVMTAKVGGQEVSDTFLVAAYRRPDFRVDASLGSESSLAGTSLKGVVTGRYLFGSPMSQRGVRWTFSRSPLDSPPRAVTDAFPESIFLGEEEPRRTTETLETQQVPLDGQGRLALELKTSLEAGYPWEYTLEGEVTDVSRQTLAGRASFRVEAAPWYIGLKRPPYFAQVATGADTEVVAADPGGKPVPGVAIHLTLTRVQWHSVRREEGQGYYSWETRREEIGAGEYDVTTSDVPVPLHLPLNAGGYFVLRATAKDSEGRSTSTLLGFYALGPGYTAWERYDTNRIDLVPERKSYRPGDVARILVKSPWEKATALLTTEREGVRTRRTFALTSTQQTVTVPIAEDSIPNIFVSLLLVKGRTGSYAQDDTSDPGKPAYRMGYVELQVEDATKRLKVVVGSDREEYRPASKARIDLTVQDSSGRSSETEVTLWAVDYGVLSLTAYKTPDVLGSVYRAKALGVMNEDSRQNIISRRVLVSKGGDEGGGGGAEEGPENAVRKDFRVLAFWLGSFVTDAHGKATAEVTLPESLTTYRVMAVASDKASHFGFGERELRISKPVLLKSAFPRFLALGDRAFFGSVVHSQLKEKGLATVTMRSLDPGILEILGDGAQRVDVEGSAEVRFAVKAKAEGQARVQMSVKLLGEADAFEEVLPVRILGSPGVVAAYGEARPEASEALDLPQGVVPSFGGLHMEFSSTSLVGLGEGARYLVEYPYGCAEQRSSTTLGLLLAAELGKAFSLPGIEPSALRTVAQSTLKELEGFQCGDGGFSYWPGGCPQTSAYLTSYVLHVFQRGAKLGYTVKPALLEKGYAFLERSLGEGPPSEELEWGTYTASQAFAAKVLAEGGRNVDSPVTRLFSHVDRLPVFGVAYLLDAMTARGETGERARKLEARIKNAILPEAGSAHVEETQDPHIVWLWSSSVRSTAIALGSLVRDTKDGVLTPGLVRWLMKTRTKGRWGNTQENGAVMEALVDYYKEYEKEIPDFTSVVSLGAETLASPGFHGRSTEAETKDVPMVALLGLSRPGERLPLTLKREGTGTLHYLTRLQYLSSDLPKEGLDHGFSITRNYAPRTGGETFQAGDLIDVTLTLRLTKERRFVAVTDPLPAGFEAVESWFATTAADLVQSRRDEKLWDADGFDHVERHDDRVQLFATRLREGTHTFKYAVRATTGGTFLVAPAHAEEMYEPESFGRTASAQVEVRP
jgi:uncharacterized protein YfaS (alpha-2-macroglobulin family)